MSSVRDGDHESTIRVRPTHLDLPMQGIRDGAFLRIPEGAYRTIRVHSFPEECGGVEPFVMAVVDRLNRHSGEVSLEFQNARGAANVRSVTRFEAVDGGPEPRPTADRPLLPERVYDALVTAGTVVTRLEELPGPETPLLRDALRKAGGACSAWQGPEPAARIRFEARRAISRTGSLILLDGSKDEPNWLPEDWEVLSVHGDDAAAIDRAIANSAGDVLWFARSGHDLNRVALDRLHGALQDTAVRPRGNAGCLEGLMTTRRAAILAGAVDAQLNEHRLNLEDWLLRLESRNAFRCRELDITGFEPSAGDPKVSQAALERFVHRWEAPRRTHSRGGRISLCMIVRNEAAMLPRCIESVKDCVDEIVIVDTGSTDGTQDIAREHGARVIEHAWRDDFAAARNLSLCAATGDWVLVLDADEVVTPAGAVAIRAACQQDDAIGHQVKIRNLDDDGQITSEVLIVRLFRRLPGIRFQNRIHEQVSPSLLAAGNRVGQTIRVSDKIVLDHYGYTATTWHDRSKDERNERLFELQLRDRPKDAYTLYKYGDFLRRQPEREVESNALLDRALDVLLKAPLKEAAEWPFASEVAALCALRALRNDDLVHAQDIVEEALARFFASPNLCWVAAHVDLRRREPARAVPLLRRCLAFDHSVLAVPIQAGVTSHSAHVSLAEAFVQLGDTPRARRHLLTALGMAPNDEAATLGLARLHLRERDVSAALDELASFLRRYPESVGVCREAALLLARIGQTDPAARLADRADRLEAAFR